jgi:transcription elongation factor Elf1
MATKTIRSLGVVCPFCGTSEPSLSLDPNNLDEITCGDCSESYTVADAVDKAKEALAAWQRLASWIDLAPTAD